MKKIFLDESNVGVAISWFRNNMKKQYKLQKLQYDPIAKKWVLTLEKLYPHKDDSSQQNNSPKKAIP
ncbi:hypothetical protein V6C27_03925 [Peptococcaceae bacterium 1198_IL3148]